MSLLLLNMTPCEAQTMSPSATPGAKAKSATVFISVATSTGSQSGSGFVLSSTGDSSIVITANHVVEGGTAIDVIFDSDDSKRFAAKVVSRDHDKDVAILRVGVGNRPFLRLAAASNIQEGEPITLIGYPVATLNYRRYQGDALRPTFHSGIISAIRFRGEVVQFDAATYHGDSGGPIIDQAGEVVAIVHGATLDPHYASLGLEQPLPGTSFGPSSTTIQTVIDDAETAPAEPSKTSSVVPSSTDVKPSPSSSPDIGSSAAYRIGYGQISLADQNPLSLEIDTAFANNVLDRITKALSPDNSVYLVPVPNVSADLVSNPALLGGYCDDNRLEAFAYPIRSWSYQAAFASATVGLIIFDCYGQTF